MYRSGFDVGLGVEDQEGHVRSDPNIIAHVASYSVRFLARSLSDLLNPILCDVLQFERLHLMISNMNTAHVEI